MEENTVFIFTSDNGPLYDRLGGTDTDFFNSAGGLRGRKGSLYEGGVRVPLIVRWKGTIAPNTSSPRVSGFEDWLPTIAEITGEHLPQRTDGISMLPTLLGKAQQALLSSDARTALALAESHQQRFPAGALTEEREAIAIEALIVLDGSSSNDARLRFEKFRTTYPRSGYRQRLDRLVVKP